MRRPSASGSSSSIRRSTSRSAPARSRTLATGSAPAGTALHAAASGSTTARSRRSRGCPTSGRFRRGCRGRRGGERYLALVQKMRAAIPDLAFGTDIIVGFPGETEADFLETLEVVAEVGYDSAFTFVYSPRAGTEAAAMPDQVPHELKIERMERLVEVVQRSARARNEQRVGRIEQVLVEGPSRTDPALLRGRTRRNTTVNFTGAASAGELVDVQIESATSTTLRGLQHGLVSAVPPG